MFSEPIDLMKIYLKEIVSVRLRTGEFVTGSLMGFDEHFNTLITTEGGDVFIRGENIILFTQP